MDNESQSVLDLFTEGGESPKQEQETTNPATIEETEEVDTTTEGEEEQLAKAGEATLVEPEVKVDYNIEVPLVNGEKMTVGKLKDYYQANQKQATDFIERENSVLRHLEEVNRLTQYLDVIPPEVKQQAALEMQHTIKQEFTRMLDVIPQWKDAVEFNKGKDSIYTLAKEYGLERDIGQVSDHRVIKLLYDYSRIRDNLQAAKEMKPMKQTQQGGKTKAPVTKADQQAALINRAKSSHSHNAELDAINSLF
jgi:hypothetical protein